MVHGFVLLPNEARRREDTGRRRAKAAVATEQRNYPTVEQLFHPDLAGDVRLEKGAVPNG